VAEEVKGCAKTATSPPASLCQASPLSVSVPACLLFAQSQCLRSVLRRFQASRGCLLAGTPVCPWTAATGSYRIGHWQLTTRRSSISAHIAN
jgi:hypothetical protein